MNVGARVTTPDGPGTVARLWVGDRRIVTWRAWVVALDDGRHRVFLESVLRMEVPSVA